MKIKIMSAFFIFIALFSGICTAKTAIYEKKDTGIAVISRAEPASKIVSFTILLKVSVYDDEAYVQGMRAFITELINAGFEELKTPDGASLFESLGVISKSEVEPDFISFTFTCLSKDFPYVFENVTKIISSPYSDEKIFKKAQKEYLKKYKDKNGIIDNVYSIFLSVFYRYHPYRRINQYSPKLIEGMTYEKTREFIKDLFTADKIVVSVSGKFDEDQVFSAVDSTFAKLPSAESRTFDIQWEPKAAVKQNFLSALSNNGWLIIGFSAPSYNSPDYPAMCIAQNIVGSGFTSRLWIEIREKSGLAYDLGALYPSLEGPAHIMFYAVIQPKNAMKVRKIAMDSIERLKEEGPTDEELFTAKEKVLGTYLLKTESSAGFADNSAGSYAIGNRGEDMMESKIKAITKNDVIKVINKYFNEPTVMIVRPPGIYINDTWL